MFAMLAFMGLGALIELALAVAQVWTQGAKVLRWAILVLSTWLLTTVAKGTRSFFQRKNDKFLRPRSYSIFSTW